MSAPTGKNSSFSPAALGVLLASAAALFALSVLLSAFGDGDAPTGERAGPGSYSASALGQAGAYDLLKRLGRPVSRGLGRNLGRVGEHGTLILAEPDLSALRDEEGLTLLEAPRLLLVLPKWRGYPDPDRPAWIKRAELQPQVTARQTLALVDGPGQVAHAAWPATWPVNELGFTPAGSGWVQLMRSQALRPVVGTDDGMLVGEMRRDDQVIWVLADPDLMANHGLGQGDNAAFFVALVEALRMTDNDDPTAPLVFDETGHGFGVADRNPLQLLFRFPFVVVTVLAGLSAVLLLLAGAGRFGAPRPTPPALDFGKAGLIDNGARLLDYAGHQADILKRYVRLEVRSVGRELHAPAGLAGFALAEWLDRIGRARGVDASCQTLMLAMANLEGDDPRNLSRLSALARDIHHWKGKILNGAPTRRRHH